MTNLIPALRSRLKFNPNYFVKFFTGYDGRKEFLAGSGAENDRLAPLHEMLLRVVEAAEETSRTICKPISMTDALIKLSEIETRIDTALAPLRKEVGE